MKKTKKNEVSKSAKNSGKKAKQKRQERLLDFTTLLTKRLIENLEET